jgi:hypothetical protein
MKKILLAAVLLLGAVAGKAQFEAGTKYIGASVTNLGLAYNSEKKLHFGLEATGGYFLWDNIMLKGSLGYQHGRPHDDNISVGLGGRYYFDQNGIFLGAGTRFADMTNDLDFQPNVSVGYAFFLNRTVTVEPELYFNLSTKDIDYSNYGLRIGLGIYLFRN